MSYIKFHAVSETHGFAVEKMQKRWRIVYVRRGLDGILVKEATSYANGVMLEFGSPFIADHHIRTQLLPLYKRAA